MKPIPASAAKVAAATAKRVGYGACAICAECGGFLLVPNETMPQDQTKIIDYPWVHRTTGEKECS